MARRAQKLKKNVEGFRDAFGIFHPIRSGAKEQGSLYDAGLAGDYDFPAEREDRRAANQKKAEQIYEARQLADALDGALGDERKISLSQFVRRAGGLKYDPKDARNADRGELDTFSFKETKKKGIAHKNGKYTFDGMREQANEAGYPPMTTVNDFIDALAKDLRTGDVLPFFSADAHLRNPTRPAEMWKTRIKEIGSAIKFFQKRGKTAKAKKLEKARTIAQTLAKRANAAETTMKKTSKTKKRTTAKPAPKKRPKRNGILETAAQLAVAATGATELYDRFKTKKPVSAKKVRKSDVVNPAGKFRVGDRVRVGKGKGFDGYVIAAASPDRIAGTPRYKVRLDDPPPTHSGRAAQAEIVEEFFLTKINPSKPKKNLSENADLHEKEFDRLLIQIENGDVSKIRLAKAKGKLAGYSQNEVDILTHRARLTHRLKQNPARVNWADAEKLVHNGAIKRLWARGRAVGAYRRRLKLESRLARVREQQSKFESRAKKNVAKKKRSTTPAKTAMRPGKKRIVKNGDAFYDFQGREATKTLERQTPVGAPKRLYCLGILLELRLKGHANLDFRKESNGKNREFLICADENNRQLWIAGGAIGTADKSIRDGENEILAPITHIVYRTQKAHLGDVDLPSNYIHKFGEEGGAQPLLGLDNQGFPIISGGDYEITPLGIKD